MEREITKEFTMKIFGMLIVFGLFAILAGSFIQDMQLVAPGGCSGGAYDGRPALVEECRHAREVKVRQEKHGIGKAITVGWPLGGDYECGEWLGGTVCWNDVEVCYPDGECYYVGNVEDYCEQYGECVPPWVTPGPGPDPYPGPGPIQEPYP